MCKVNIDTQKSTETETVADSEPVIKTKMAHVPKLHIVNEGANPDDSLQIIDVDPLPIMGTHDSRHLG